MTAVSESSTRIGPGLLRCPARSCRYVLRVEDLVTTYRWRQGASPGAERLEKRILEDRSCPEHWKRLTGGPIEAVIVPGSACGEACRLAVGRFCRCSCAGVSHGAGWR